LIKNSHPFGKKCQKTAGGIFLTHTVHTRYRTFSADIRATCTQASRVLSSIVLLLANLKLSSRCDVYKSTAIVLLFAKKTIH